eukprot:1589691-Lingulodinium_polyedra.AAC.1
MRRPTGVWYEGIQTVDLWRATGALRAASAPARRLRLRPFAAVRVHGAKRGRIGPPPNKTG